MKIINLAKVFFLVGVLFLVAPFTFGQAKASVSKQSQWEYLVISFGKVYFSNPLTDSEAKASGDSKLISFSQEGIVLANEGLTTQRYMDTLGKFGWELVSVVGAIGGDQEMLFKRPFDENRSKQEEELIKKEGERIRNLVLEERSKVAAAVPATELVDLDDAERIAARNANRRSQEERLKQAAQSVTDYPMTIESVVSNAYSAKDTDVTISIISDGTNALLTDGNKYRSSEAKKLADSIAKAIVRAAGVKERESYGSDSSLGYMLGKVKISVEVVIKHNGKNKTVATSRTGGDW